MAYRDGFERCPRCHVALVDARAARGCRECGGLWLDEPTFREMLQTMAPSRLLDQLELDPVPRIEVSLGCPTCGQPLEKVAIHHVPLDRCAKHGIWFDARELETALHRVGLWASDPQQGDDHLPVTLAFVITRPDGVRSQISVVGPIIKIGADASAHVLIVKDPDVASVHAVIEVTREGELAMNGLGPPHQTRVNGDPVLRASLRVGDRITVGGTEIELRSMG